MACESFLKRSKHPPSPSFSPPASLSSSLHHRLSLSLFLSLCLCSSLCQPPLSFSLPFTHSVLLSFSLVLCLFLLPSLHLFVFPSMKVNISSTSYLFTSSRCFRLASRLFSLERCFKYARSNFERDNGERSPWFLLHFPISNCWTAFN